MRKSTIRSQTGLILILLNFGFISHLNAEKTFEFLLNEVELNEAMYDDIDIKIDYTYQAGPASPRLKKTDNSNVQAFESNKNFIWYVGQEGKYRVGAEANQLFQNGSSSKSDHIKMYDGENTRLLEQNQIANIIQGYAGDNFRIRPHMLFLRGPFYYMSLSTLLSGDEAIASSPEVKWPAGRSLQYTYKGEANFNGLKCQKICLTILVNDKPVRRLEFWLAEDRNFIPARLFSYQLKTSKDQPRGEGEVLDWIEVNPGIWFPGETTFTSYSPLLLKKGKKIAQWTKTYKTKEVSLDPHYDLSFFQDIEIPDGTAVYEVEDQKIKKSYKQGALSDPEVAAAPPSSWWQNPLIIINGVFILLLISVMTWQRKRKTNTPSELKI